MRETWRWARLSAVANRIPSPVACTPGLPTRYAERRLPPHPCGALPPDRQERVRQSCTHRPVPPELRSCLLGPHWQSGRRLAARACVAPRSFRGNVEGRSSDVGFLESAVSSLGRSSAVLPVVAGVRGRCAAGRALTV